MNQVSYSKNQIDSLGTNISLAPRKQWSLAEWISNFLQDDHPYYADYDADDTYGSVHDPMPGGDADGLYEDVLEDGIFESLLIICLAAALVFLIVYRQQRQEAHRRGEGAAANVQPNAQPANEEAPNRGLFPQPGDPNLNDWAAGGVGH